MIQQHSDFGKGMSETKEKLQKLGKWVKILLRFSYLTNSFLAWQSGTHKYQFIMVFSE